MSWHWGQIKQNLNNTFETHRIFMGYHLISQVQTRSAPASGKNWWGRSRDMEKDWPPIYSGEQSFQLTFAECEGSEFCYLTFSLRVLPALNLTTFEAGILIFSPVRGFRPSR